MKFTVEQDITIKLKRLQADSLAGVTYLIAQWERINQVEHKLRVEFIRIEPPREPLFEWQAYIYCKE